MHNKHSEGVQNGIKFQKNISVRVLELREENSAVNSIAQ